MPEGPTRVGIQAGGHTATVSAERLPLVVVSVFQRGAPLDPARLGRSRIGSRLHSCSSTTARQTAPPRCSDGFGTPRGTASRCSRFRGTSGRRRPFDAGLVQALDSGAPIVGYYDADLATPPDELLRLSISSRVDPTSSSCWPRASALLGRRIQRRATRHYLGRVFATFASFIAAHPGLRHAVRREGHAASSPAVREAVDTPVQVDVGLRCRADRTAACAARVPPIRCRSPRSRRCPCSRGATSPARGCGYATWGARSWICSRSRFGCIDRVHAGRTRRTSRKCRTIGAHTASRRTSP